MVILQVMQGLAKSIAWDGEGATCLIEVCTLVKMLRILVVLTTKCVYRVKNRLFVLVCLLLCEFTKSIDMMPILFPFLYFLIFQIRFPF